MTDLFRLLIVVPLAYVGAVIAAGFTTAIGYFGPGIDQTGWFAGSAALFAISAGGISFIPAIVAIVFAEVFAWRSVFLWLALGGAIGLAADRFVPELYAPSMDGRRLAIFLAAGFVGGFVYWLIAGRFAGVGKPTSPR
jgi:hypothetical protein